MQIFLLALLALASITLLIRYLHQSHVRNRQDIAEISSPLPPLEVDASATGQRRKVHVIDELENQITDGRYWCDEVKSLRTSGYFKEALSLSRRQYPKMLAFRQTLITLRASLKQETPDSKESLADLYRTAILGDIARAGSNDKSCLQDVNQLSSELKDPQRFWDTLGYRNLGLLTKTDCKTLVKHWGEPAGHSNTTTLIADLDRNQ